MGSKITLYTLVYKSKFWTILILAYPILWWQVVHNYIHCKWRKYCRIFKKIVKLVVPPNKQVSATQFQNFLFMTLSSNYYKFWERHFQLSPWVPAYSAVTNGSGSSKILKGAGTKNLGVSYPLENSSVLVHLFSAYAKICCFLFFQFPTPTPTPCFCRLWQWRHHQVPIQWLCGTLSSTLCKLYVYFYSKCFSRV